MENDNALLVYDLGELKQGSHTLIYIYNGELVGDHTEVRLISTAHQPMKAQLVSATATIAITDVRWRRID
jgi:hypothetical protein